MIPTISKSIFLFGKIKHNQTRPEPISKFLSETSPDGLQSDTHTPMRIGQWLKIKNLVVPKQERAMEMETGAHQRIRQ